MALKYELEQWGAAVEAYDQKDYDEALRLFENIPESAKFYFNTGLIYATLGEHKEACQAYKQAVRLDQYLAIAYFQKGVSHFLLSEFDQASRCFNDALQHLRGNMLIDYDQLGLKFRLYSCEILFNRGLCYLYMGRTEDGMNDFAYAVNEKQTEEHDVIDEAISSVGQGFTVFSIPVGIIYRPPEGKLKNVKTKDYLGKAKLIAAIDSEDAFTGFTGAQKKQTAQANTTTPIANDKTSGKVAPLNSSSRPGSPSEGQRPRSLSTNPRQPPFPVYNGPRNPGVRRSPSRSPFTNSGNEENNYNRVLSPPRISEKNQDRYTVRNTPPGKISLIPSSSENITPISRPPPPRRPKELPLVHQRSNTIDSGRGSPKFPTIQRQKSLRSSPSQRREPSPSRLDLVKPQQAPRRQNTQARAQFLQKQMQASQVQMSPDGYYEEPREDYNRLYEYAASSTDDYYPGDSRDSSNSRQPNLKSSRLQTGLLTPENPEKEVHSYASMIFGKDDDDNYQYGEYDDTQFEIVTPLKKTPKPELPKPQMSKIKIKCYHKDTRVILVLATIIYDELLQRIQEKFEASTLRITYKDEDGEKVMMTDQEDLEMAISLISNVNDDIGRMELWLEDGK